jgi:hypothetical protein
MTTTVRYALAAPPERVIASIAASARPGSALGFSFSDLTARPLVGAIRADGSFSVRRARGFGTTPRFLVVRGSVRPDGVGSDVSAEFALHPAVRIWRALVVVLFIGGSLAVLPAAATQPALLPVVITLGAIAGLMLLPIQLLAHEDHEPLRLAFEAMLRHSGEITRR